MHDAYHLNSIACFLISLHMRVTIMSFSLARTTQLLHAMPLLYLLSPLWFVYKNAFSLFNLCLRKNVFVQYDAYQLKSIACFQYNHTLEFNDLMIM